MHRWSPLNDRQLALLTRVGDGAEPVASDSPEFALTARALKERCLITMPEQDGKRQAEITDAGRFYLEHLQQVGAAGAMVKEAVTAEGLRAAVFPILIPPERREQMANQGRAAGRPDAADRLTDVLLSVAVRGACDSAARSVTCPGHLMTGSALALRTRADDG